MPLSLDLTVNPQYPNAGPANRNEGLAITVTPDTISITVNASIPRGVVFRPTVDATITAASVTGFAFPIAAGAALSLEIAANTVFTVAAASAGGTMHLFVIK